MNQLSIEPIFYVYVYLDPRKPGDYRYGQYVFQYQPFYAGKGQYTRKTDHLGYANNLKQCSHKSNKIRKIRRQFGSEPIIIEYKSNMIQIQALQLQKDMIKVIGRADLGTGPLTNLTEGGQGVSGYICTEEVRKMRSENQMGPKNHNFGKTFPKSHTDKIAIGVALYKRTKEHRDNLKKSREFTSEETRRKSSESHKGLPSPRKGAILTDYTKGKISQTLKEKGIPQDQLDKMAEGRRLLAEKNRTQKLAKYEKLGFNVLEIRGRFYVEDVNTHQMLFFKDGCKDLTGAFKMINKFLKDKGLTNN